MDEIHKEKKKAVLVELPETLVKLVDSERKKHEVTRTKFIQYAIEFYLHYAKKGDKP